MDGIQLWVASGSTVGYYSVSGKDVYPGGWINLVVDLSRNVDEGTKPTNMSWVTTLGFRIKLSAAGKNAINTWFDNFIYADGLSVYGDDGGDYFDFEDIYNVENTTTGSWGVVRKIGGVYFLTGKIQFGDSVGVSGCKFNAQSQAIVFENRKVNNNLYSFDVRDNGTGTTEFILGSKQGTSGILGCSVRVADAGQECKFCISGTDSNISDFKLYGSTFCKSDKILLPPSASNIEVLNCNFESCGEVYGNTCPKQYCNFLSSESTVSGSICIDSTNHNLSNCNFINCSRAIRFPSGTQGSYIFISDMFTGNTVDIKNENASGSILTINCAGTPSSNPSSHEEPYESTTTIVNTKVLTLSNLVTGSEVRILSSSTTTELGGIESCSASFQYSYTYTANSYIDIVVHNNDYLYWRLDGYLLQSADVSLPIQQTKDRQYLNP